MDRAAQWSTVHGFTESAIVLEGIKEKTGKSTDDWDVGRFEEIEVLNFHR